MTDPAEGDLGEDVEDALMDAVDEEFVLGDDEAEALAEELDEQTVDLVHMHLKEMELDDGNLLVVKGYPMGAINRVLDTVGAIVKGSDDLDIHALALPTQPGQVEVDLDALSPEEIAKVVPDEALADAYERVRDEP